MRTLKRNQLPFHYALYEGKQPITDEWGNQTGEYEIIHSTPVKAFANISPAIGESESRQFGENLSYDKVIVFAENLPIDEFSILWVDTDDTSQAHDYVVKKVAKSLNSTSIAIEKVVVSNG
ncbi:MAG: hypothetical protein ACK5L6_13565 [Anaerorhabdus sp.]|uniref:hypothetical protein n=1 Tax=Anaerorhabdus sp. TaxID=1872524 RepID=UPI003A8365C2